jgi:outer membrane receptor protein involved in Fe transport
MKRSSRVLWAFIGVMAAQASFAAELLVNTFLESRPFSGVEVELDGRLVGETGSLGDVTVPLTPGNRTLGLLKNGVSLAEYSFAVAAGESAEISVSFADFANPPEITLATFRADEPRTADGPPGTVTGEVRGEAGAPVAGARVRVAEIDVSTVSDQSGRFSLSLPRGVYTLVVEREGFQTVEQPNLRVVANIGLAASIRLYPESDGVAAAPTTTGSADEEVVVFGVYRPTENTTDLERFSMNIVNAISIDDLLKFGDSDVAATLKRLVGVSVTGGRYAVVRGLDGRYISTTFNGSLMPSTDPYRRDTQLDLFPADLLQLIEVQKSFSANLPGDTTGGNINIRTVGRPDEDYTKLGVSFGGTSGVTGKDRLTYAGGNRDRLGIDDGIRELPDSARLVATPNRSIPPGVSEQASRDLTNIFNTSTSSNELDHGATLALGRIRNLAGGASLGISAVADYSYGTSAQIDAVRARDFSSVLNSNNVLGGNPYSDVTETATAAKLTGYLSATYESANDWTLESKTTLLRDSEDSVRTEFGVDTQGDNFLDATTLEWIERAFYAQQFSLTLPLRNGSDTLQADLGVFQTQRNAPDRRRYEFRNGALNSLQRFFSDLDERTYTFAANYTLPLRWFDRADSSLILGGNIARSDRTADVFTLGFSPGFSASDGQNVELLVARAIADGAVYTRQTQATDPYEADQTLYGVFVSNEVELSPSLTVIGGLRFESYTLDTIYPFDPNPLDAVEPVDESELLPSLAAIYRIGSDWQLRGAYARTVSRPNITERARSRFFDDQDRQILGCAPSADCSAATIDSYDLRAEFYPAAGGSLSVAVFYKDIDNPLEVALAPIVAETRALQYLNNQAATVSGLELDGSRQFDLEGWGLDLGANVAFIRSEVDLDAQAQQLERISKRRLQGQSPFLANLNATLEHFASRQRLTLAINYFHDRIDGLGNGSEPLLLEDGRALVNLTYGASLTERLSLSGKLTNLLDTPIEYSQGGLLIERYKAGVGLSAGLSYTFN